MYEDAPMYPVHSHFPRSVAALSAAAFALVLTGFPAPPIAAAAGDPAAPAVTRLPLRDGARNPQVAVSGNSLWVVYVMKDENNAYCRRSQDGGATWSVPTRINSTPGCVSSAMERGPRIAVGKDGVLHVVWAPQWPPGGDQVWYSQTRDGLDFTPQRDIRQVPKPHDEPNVTADGQGNVYATWLDSRSPADPNSPVAAPIYLAVSHDNGATWAPSEKIRSDYPGNFCGCCMPRPFLGADGSIYLAARGGYQNVRDIWLLHQLPDQTWKSTRISNNNWILNGCPMSGPSTAMGPDGIDVAWMSQGRVYWNRLAPGAAAPGPAIGLRAPAGSPAGQQNYPLVLTNPQGITCAAWNQGGDVCWETFSRTMDPIASGDLGTGIGDGFAAGRVTGFVTPAGDFKVVF